MRSSKRPRHGSIRSSTRRRREAFEEAEFEAGEAAGDDNDGDDSFAFGALAEESRTDDTQGEAAEAVPAARARRPVGPAWHGAGLKTAAEMLGDESAVVGGRPRAVSGGQRTQPSPLAGEGG